MSGKRLCRACGSPLSRRADEKAADWLGRKHCDRACYLRLREREARVGPEPKSARRRAPEYDAWSNIIQRCTNPAHPNFKHYGGRGVSVCDRWRSYDDFLADVGLRPSPRHTIERADNERGYEPGNARWATWAEQARNRRTSRLLTAQGVTMNIADWAARLGVCTSVLIYRIDRAGWSVERAVSTPPGPFGRRRAA